MLNTAIALMLFIKLSGLPLWLCLLIVGMCVVADRISDNARGKVDHLRFATIQKGLMNIIVRMKGK